MASANLTPLKKPLKRRIGDLVVRIHDWGIEIKRYRCREWRRATWEQIASLADESEPILLAEELARGSRVLKELGPRRNHAG